MEKNNCTILSLIIILLLVRYSGTVGPAAAACISYSSSSKTITVSCTTLTHLNDVNTAINNNSVLQKLSGGVWTLAANLVIAKGANLVIDSTDGTWLKIISDGTVAFGIKNSGGLKIDTFKVTSWNSATNDYASPGTGSTPRAYIVSQGGGTGKTNILNSEIAHLGYSGSGHHGLDYYGGDGSIVQNNQIHHLWRAFYSSGVGGIQLDKNVVHDSYEYGIDPHSGTHDMYITNNNVYNNNHGVICSVACFNMHIENNELYNNQRDGIFLDAGSHHSTIANNIIHDVPDGIQLPSLSYSEIYGNTIYNSKVGIQIYQQIGSSFDRDGRCVPYGCVSINNNIHNNNIKASSIGVEIKGGASTNTVASNIIDAANGDRGIVVDGSGTNGNIFKDNHLSNAKYAIRLTGGNTGSKLSNNHLETVFGSGEYTLSGASSANIDTTQFSSDVIRSLDSSSNKVAISNSGTISVVDGSTGQTTTYNTNSQPYTKTLGSNGKVTVTSTGSSPPPASSSSTASSPGIALTAKNTANPVADNETGTIVKSGDNSAVSYNGTDVKQGRKAAAWGISSAETNDEKPITSQIKEKKLLAEEQAKLALQEAQIKLKANTDNHDHNHDHTGVSDLKSRNEQFSIADNKQNMPYKPEKVQLVDSDAQVKKHVTKKQTHIINTDKSPYDKGKNIAHNSRQASDGNLQESLVHQTLLILKVSHGVPNGKYVLTGTFWDKTASRPLEGMKIYFTTSDPSIKVSDLITNKVGAFRIDISNLPLTPGAYGIQAHFAKVYPYEAADSQTVTLTVKNSADLLNEAEPLEGWR
jgi:parallel beta-helix repeat protein